MVISSLETKSLLIFMKQSVKELLRRLMQSFLRLLVRLQWKSSKPGNRAYVVMRFDENKLLVCINNTTFTTVTNTQYEELKKRLKIDEK
jgi:hypothetical protein